LKKAKAKAKALLKKAKAKAKAKAKKAKKAAKAAIAAAKAKLKGEKAALKVAEKKRKTKNGICKKGMSLVQALEWAATHHLSPESSFPYTSGEFGNRGVCSAKAAKKSKNKKGKKQVKGWGFAIKPCFAADCSKQDEVKLAKQLRWGPVNALIAGNVLQNYKSGIIQSQHCGKNHNGYSHLNHAVQIVGLGTAKNGQKYYIVRNTWGTNWGEAGYFKLAWGENTCGIANFVTMVHA